MIRTPAVAGLFYPADPHRLQAQIQQMLAASVPRALQVKALIVPHAGYLYSGLIAASAYRLLQQQAKVRRVVLLGPAHHLYVKGLALSSATAFATPLGEVPVDAEALEKVSRMDQVMFCDSAHAPEHSLEVQLPFLQSVLSDFLLLPILVGDVGRTVTAEVIDRLWEDSPQTLVIASSDLSHFHSSGEARRIDRATSDAILAMTGVLTGEQACGCRAVNGLLYNAKQRGLSITELACGNSGDITGDRERVVGYGAYAIH